MFEIFRKLELTSFACSMSCLTDIQRFNGKGALTGGLLHLPLSRPLPIKVAIMIPI